MTTERYSCDVLVIGSGPGGAQSAALLAEAGRDVVLVEEGPDLPVGSAPSYSLAEMGQKYRNNGLTPAFGPTPVTYIEGRCVGGASEINAALYHRPHPETLSAWARDFAIRDFGPEQLESRFAGVEADFEVSGQPNGQGPASELLERGARKLGWKSGEIQRFWRYRPGPDGALRGERRSMSVVMIPRLRAAGGRLLADTRIDRLRCFQGRAIAAVGRRKGEDGREVDVSIYFREVLVCAGAVQGPALLRRSGFTRRIGDGLRLHPMVRIAARFPFEMNEPSWGVPVHQVEEFKPAITLGCSHSSLPHLALWLQGDVPDKEARLAAWRQMGVFYVAVQGSGRGSVRNVPGFSDPFVRYPLTDEDMQRLGQGLCHLGQLLFAAGATELYSPIGGGGVLSSPRDLEQWRGGLPHRKVNITTIHLFSSAPMGEAEECPVDSYGRLKGAANIYVNDASLLPTSPGVNPQGTILAIARRNVQHMLGQAAP